MESKKYDLIFITTFVVNDLVENLVSSIIESNTKVNLLLLVVCQNGNLIDDWNSENISVKTLSVSFMLSLSSARNLAIRYILENNIEASHVMFPDDDSTFDYSFFDRYHSCASEGVNYIVDIYCTNTNVLFKKHKFIFGKTLSYLDWGAACSVNMLISFDTFLKVGFFDEKLGVGTHYGAGEDNDYFIRSCYSSNGFIYNDSLYNYHPASKWKYKQCSVKQLVVRFNNYGKGVVYCF